MPTRLDEAIGRYDFMERHEAIIAASPARVFAALRDLTIDDVPVFRVLVALRALPSRLLRRRSPAAAPPARLLERFLAAGFAVLAEAPDEELVLGVIGRFWELRGSQNLRLADSSRFVAFDAPGYAKAAISFRAEPAGGRTRFSTETRILATDAAARRDFGRYWGLIRPWSGAIRREWLNAVRRRAERP